MRSITQKQFILIIYLLTFFNCINVFAAVKNNCQDTSGLINEQNYYTFQKLDLSPSNKKIENVFHIHMSKKDFSALKKTKHLEKNYISSCSINYNNDSLSVKKIELRGKNSMSYRRKSFSIILNEKITITKNGKTKKLKRFNLISMSMDQNYFRNKVAFDLMSKLQLFNLFFVYSEVIVNNKTQGIYLLVEKPKNYAFKECKANFMVRRTYKNQIKKVYFKEKGTVKTQNEYEKTFARIYNDFDFVSGQKYYNELSKILNLEQYFIWIAFNYLVGNGDYTDEIFFYNDPENKSIKLALYD